MKLSYSTWGMQTTPIDDAVRHCADLGFDGLELTVIPGWPTDAATLDRSERRRIRALYDDAGVELCGMSGNVPLLVDDSTQADANEARFRTYLDLAAELQRPDERLIVTTTTGGAPSDWETRKGEVIERVGRLARYADERGVMIGVEPHVGAALHRPEDVIWLVEQIGAPGLTIHFDISHFNVQGIPMEESVALLAPMSLHTHVKDERGLAPDHAFLIPGEGEMDYARYLTLMREAGYDGHIVVEISVMVQARPEYDALAAATQSYEVLSRAFESAGIERDRP
ncbi:MAG TPA: sugar phosphate isomerase/epimerase [Thermomicrobiales bacterium]|nr:sugar phosphate isomerase/epimerase [Thermomicrobiales bacterium]